MTLKLTDNQLDNIRLIALQFGFVARRGPLAGSGSVQQMIEAIADRDYQIYLVPTNDKQ